METLNETAREMEAPKKLNSEIADLTKVEVYIEELKEFGKQDSGDIFSDIVKQAHKTEDLAMFIDYVEEMTINPVQVSSIFRVVTNKDALTEAIEAVNFGVTELYEEGIASYELSQEFYARNKKIADLTADLFAHGAKIIKLLGSIAHNLLHEESLTDEQRAVIV